MPNANVRASATVLPGPTASRAPKVGVANFATPSTQRPAAEFSPTIRRRLEAALENLVWLLDAIDGDADFEATAHESSAYDPDNQRGWARNSRTPDDHEDGYDMECAS
jgi:hypothetical protein